MDTMLTDKTLGILKPGGAVVQVERVKQNGTPTQVILRWVEPELQPKQAKEYDLEFTADDPTRARFHFTDGDGYRDLLFDTQTIYRHMIRYDPVDPQHRYKPFHHLFGLPDDGFL